VAELHPALPVARPLAIAHRAGNDPAGVELAVSIGADLIEVDLWRFEGRLEIRHLKTMGPIPLLWDRWKLAPGWTPRFTLDKLLELAPAATLLLIDLKGIDPLLPEQLMATLRAHVDHPPVLVCSRSWPLLDALRGEEEPPLIYSVGNLQELAAVSSRLEGMTHPAVSIHAGLLTPAVMAELKARGTTVISWPVNSEACLAQLTALGVDGMTSDNPVLIESIVRSRAAKPAEDSKR